MTSTKAAQLDALKALSASIQELTSYVKAQPDDAPMLESAFAFAIVDVDERKNSL